MQNKVSFVVGTANLDVSGRVRSEILSLAEKCSGEDSRIVYIVPEQFEYETEIAVYRLLEKQGLLTKSRVIKTTTFSALSREILDQSGETRPIADDIVKNIVMRRTVNECESLLEALGGICKKPGFTQKILGTIDSLKSVGLDFRALESSLEEIKSSGVFSSKMLLLKKLSDVSLLYTAYSARLAQANYLDAPDIASLAADKLVKSGLLDNTYVFVDCFNDFTAGQLRFLSRLITAANSTMFAFTSDIGSRNDVFSAANANIAAIRSFAEKDGIETTVITECIPPRIAEGTPLCELSDKVFTGKSSDVPAGDAIEVISASNVYEELDFVCSKIIALADEKGLRYRDIAVLCTDLGTYGRYAETAFKKYNIPLFLDYREPILHQPLVNAVIATLKALGDFSVDTVLSCIKTGFFSKFDAEKNKRVGLSDYDVSVFENYVYEWAIETDHLKKEFTFHNKNLEKDEAMLAAEQVRKGAAQPLWELSRKISKKPVNGAKLTELLYEFLMDTVGMRRALTAKSTDSEKGIDRDTADLYRRLWNELVHIFEALHSELKDVDISLEDYAELFRGLCSETTLSSPPQMVDSVLVGDIDRTRAEGIRAVFIVGATYDLFPTPASQLGIFSEYENELIHENLKRAGEFDVQEYCVKSAREQFSLALYRAYKALTLPLEYLCLTCPRMNADGDGTELSEVIDRCRYVFKDLRVKDAASFGNEFYCRSERAAKSRFAMGIRSDTDENAVLREALVRSDCADFVERLEQIRAEHSSSPADGGDDTIGKHTITRDHARLLFPHRVGATAVEKLSSCGFNFFAEYGLGIRERNQRSFNAARRGDAIHYVLEKIVSRYCGDMTKLCELRRADFQALSRRYLTEYCEQETNNTFADDARSRFLFDNIANSAADVLISMQAEFYARGYRPKLFELSLDDFGCKSFIPDDGGEITDPLPAAELYSDEDSAPSDAVRAASDTNAYIETAPLVISVDSSLKVLITGRIDRVDMFTIEDKTYVRAVDYKSSVHSFSLYNAVNGINIQMLLYLIALLDANKSNPTVNLCAGGLSYIPSNSSGAQTDENSAFKLLAMNHHGSSLLVKDANTEKDLEDYTEFVLNRIAESDGKSELLSAAPEELTDTQLKEVEEYKAYLDKLRDAFRTDKFNCVDADKFEELRDNLTEMVRRKLEKLFDGSVDALPMRYKQTGVDIDGKSQSETKNPCKYCRFGEICKNAGKKFAEIQENEKEWTNKYIGDEDGD